MKNTSVLYGIAILTVVCIVACFVGYATDNTSPDMFKQPASQMTKRTQAVKKKSCACCDEKQKRVNEMVREWINEKPQENP